MDICEFLNFLTDSYRRVSMLFGVHWSVIVARDSWIFSNKFAPRDIARVSSKEVAEKEKEKEEKEK